MGISNYIPSSRLAQAGVCTSTTRPASPYEGQMIYETDTNRVLVYDASAWVMIADTDTPPALQLVKSQAVSTSNVTTVAVADAFTSEFIAYKIMYVGGVSTAANTFTMQLTGATGANYDTQLIYSTYTSGSVTGAGTSNGTSWNYCGSQGTNGNIVDIDIYQPFLARHTFMTSNFWDIAAGSARMQGVHKLATSYTGFTLNSGTSFNSGTIYVYGYRN